MDLTTYGPVLTGPVDAAPPEPGAADRPLPFDIFDVDSLGRRYLGPCGRLLAPMDLTLALLERKAFHEIAIATNLFAHGRGAGDRLMVGWRDTDWHEMYRFFFANHLISAIRGQATDISEEQLFRNPLLGRMFSQERFHQLTLAWRMKHDDQTPDEFLQFAVENVCDNFGRVVTEDVPVLNIHTYQLPLCPGGHGQMADAECRLTVLKAGRYVIRMAFHLKASDSEQSGNSPSISVSLLERLLNGMNIEGKYFICVGGATVEMAKFFHVSTDPYAHEKRLDLASLKRSSEH